MAKKKAPAKTKERRYDWAIINGENDKVVDQGILNIPEEELESALADVAQDALDERPNLEADGLIIIVGREYEVIAEQVKVKLMD